MDEVTRRAEWKKAADFAEYAEALDIRTEQILAVLPGDVHIVAFTQTVDPEDPDLWTAGFQRDSDEILRQVLPTTRREGMLSEMHKSIEQRMREHFGEAEQP
jgi:hypothetical protein